jgi:hypothetical protein
VIVTLAPEASDPEEGERLMWPASVDPTVTVKLLTGPPWAVSVNVPDAMPLTDTRPSWPVETDKVPAPADVGEDGLDDDGDDDDVDDVDDEPPADDGFVLAGANPGAPDERKASGAVVASGVEVAGGGPYPPRPDGPPRAGGGLAVLMDAPCVDPPAAPGDGPWCGPAMIPTAMAPRL